MTSICCNSKTHIGYFNVSERPDIYGITYKNVTYHVIGTFCNECGKLCDFKDGDKEYYTNGIVKLKKKYKYE